MSGLKLVDHRPGAGPPVDLIRSVNVQSDSADISAAAPPAFAKPKGKLELMSEAAVEIRDLVKRYKDKVAVDGISLEVERGSIVAILGPNGAGKTTIIGLRWWTLRCRPTCTGTTALTSRRSCTILGPPWLTCATRASSVPPGWE